MPIYQIKLIAKQEVAQGTIEFHFEKPTGFQFTPGQYGGFTLINPSEIDAKGNTRRFSLLSTPDQDYIAIATRLQPSAFKKALNRLAIGELIKFAGPTGNFVLDQTQIRPVVLIAGGIGIAPFYSMLRHHLQHDRTRDYYLFYGNQTQANTAFLSELHALQQEHSHFKCIITLDHPDTNWPGERGYITDTMIKKYVPDIFTPHYYVCGSPVMVTTLQETLAEMGINEDLIKTEDFPGY